MPKINFNARPFNLKLKNPFGISRGSITYAKNVLVTLIFDELIGYGEAAPSSYYGEDQDSVIDFLNQFIKHKSVEDYLMNIGKLQDDLNHFTLNVYRGTSASARASLEIAFWDLIGKINNKSLYQFLFHDDPFLINGLDYKNLAPTSYTIGLDNLLVIKDKVGAALNAGYKILKIKLGLGFDEDLNILKTVEQIVRGHSCLLRVDANGGWDIETTKKMLDILPKYNVEFLEQPLPKGQVRLLQPLMQNSPVQIFVDEDCVTSSHIEALAGKVHGVNIKLMKAGSVIEAFNMINLAKSYGLKVMLGCMIESSCAISAAVHLSPLADYVDLDGHLLLDHDPFSGLLLKDNKVIPSFDVGLGVYLSEN
ncbi:MAG: dipeptide epimerase [Candidatus Melainabacteria bacterium]|nr:dipeptide epimerase [Candidatus Melainabacteria bacterium]